jgi:hypothetical protein
MARQKATVTLDRRKIEEARAFTGKTSISDVIDVALDRLLQSERLRCDVAASRRAPPGGDDLWVAKLSVEFDLGDSDVDYEKDYGGKG